MPGLANLDSGVPITVHGPVGVVDLVVPAGASVWDVAREYAEIAGLASIPLIYTRGGRPLPADGVLADHQIETGAVLVAAPGAYRPARSRRLLSLRGRAGTATSAGPFVVGAGVSAVLAGLVAGWLGSDWSSPVVWALAVALLLTMIPGGRYGPQRVSVAPAFGIGLALSVAWESDPAARPGLVAIVGLVAAVTAGLARVASGHRDVALRAWTLGGGLVFVVAGGATVIGVADTKVWAVLVLMGMLAARFVPNFAVQVPDHYLIDLDRLATSAWSARAEIKATRGRVVVPVRAVRDVADAGTRMVTVSALLVLCVTVVSTTSLLTADLPRYDRVGAVLMVFFSGAALLLAARSYRHSAARAMLRLAGIWSWLLVAVLALPAAGPGWRYGAFIVAAGVGMILVAAAVATGRGWRSVWWSRRAEVAEGIAGAFAVALLFVASGLFRGLMELVSSMAPS